MVSWSWGGSARGADTGAQAGCQAGPWGCLGGFVGGGIMGGLTGNMDGSSNRQFRESLDDIWQREQRRFRWYRDHGMHPLTVLSGGSANFSGPAVSKSGRGSVSLDGIAATAEAFSKRRVERERANIARRLANAEIDERQASAERHRAEAQVARNEVLRQATSRTVASNLNSNKDDEGILGMEPLKRAPGMDAENFETRYGDLAAEVVGIGNLIRDGWLTVDFEALDKAAVRQIKKAWKPEIERLRVLQNRAKAKTAARRQRYQKARYYDYWKSRRYPGGIRP